MPFKETLLFPHITKNDEGSAIRQFDYVVSNPPFKMDFWIHAKRLQPNLHDLWAGVPKYSRKEKRRACVIYTCFIQHVINSLKKDR